MLGSAVATVLLALLLTASGWRATGGDWAVVTTPSMGQAVPVGTLVLTRPVDLVDVGVGDVVTYRPSNLPDALVTHRVVARLADGSLQVKGDINGAPDPLPVRAGDLRGEVVQHWYAVGWAVRALPLLVVGGLVLALVTRPLPPSWRSSVRVVGSCVVVAATSLALRPLVSPVILAARAHGGDRGAADGVVEAGDEALATVVSAGLLPTRVAGAHGHVADLLLGQTAALPVVAEGPGGRFSVTGSPHPTGWWAVGTVAVCLLPLAWTSLVGLATRRSDPDAVETVA